MTTPGGGTSRTVKIVVSADVAQAIRALGQTEQSLGGLGQQADQAGQKTRTMGDVMKGTLAASGIEAGISGIVSGFKGMVSSGLEYERNMNTFAAVTKANDTQMQQMGDTAKQLGADVKIPGASAQSAAAAMTELAKGGLEADEAMQAARGTMILAAAAQVDGAQAAEIQANALNTFGLKADQAGRVANVLANVANKSSGEITDFAQGLAQAGTVASSFGWSIEETTTVLGLMANAGIKGSDAGTSLKTTMTALLKPTADQAAALADLGIQTRDANGKMITAQQLTVELAAAKGRMTDADFNAAAATAFGTDAVRTALVVAQAGAGGYEEMATALGNVNGAQDVAAANSKGLSGVIDALKNTVDTASLALFEQLQPSIMQVAEAATGLVTPLASALTPALGAVADLATGTLAPALTGVTGVIAAIVEPLSSVIGWFSDLPSPIGTAVLALGGVIALRGPLVGTFTSATASFSTLLATLRGTAGAAAAGSAGLAGWIASLRAASGAAATFGVVAKGALSVLGGPIGLAIVGVTTALSLFSSTSDDAATSTEGLSSAIDEQTGKLKGNAAQVIATEAANSGASAAYERLGGNVADYVDALGGVPGAQEKVNAKIAESKAAYDEHMAAVRAASQGTAGFTGAQAAAGAAAGAAVPQISDLNTATDYLSSAQGTLAGKTDDVRLANAGAAGELAKTGDAAATAGDQMATAEEKTTPFGDALKEVRSAASEADAAAQFLSITLLQMSGNTVPAEQRARANAAAFRAVGQATRDIGDANDSVAEKQRKFDELAAHLGGTLDGQAVSATNAVVTQEDLDRAARDLADAQSAAQDASDKQKDALDKAAQSARDMTGEAFNQKAAQGDMRGAIEDAVTTMQGQREQFIKSATDAGISQTAAEELANAQGLIPENVRTTYETVGAEDATKRAKDLNDALDKINDRTVHYSVVGGEVTTVGTMRATSGGLAAYADGGLFRGAGSARSDSNVVRVSDGEFIVNAAATQRNLPLLHAVNSGAPGFADGGLVGAKVVGDYKSKDWTETLSGTINSLNEAIKNSLMSFGSNGQWGPGTDGSGLAANTQAARDFIIRNWGITNIGGVYGGSVPGSDHPIGKALDVMIANYRTAAGIAQGDSVANWFVGNPSSFGTKYVIWRDRINQGGSWAPYSHPSGNNDTLAHRDHVHLSFLSGPGAFAPGGPVPSGGGASGGGGGVEQWRGLGLDVLSQVGAYRGLNLTPFIGNMMNQIRTESSGNPNAINNYDINAQRGDPSIGLLQVIGSTFRNALRGTPFEYLIAAGQRDPRASLTASTLYSLNRYGSLDRAWRGVAYDNGGILPPGFTMAYNGTGSNEAIFTGQQFNAMAAQAVPSVNMTPRIEITNYVDAQGMLSRTEVMVDGKLADVARAIDRVMVQA